MIESYTISLIKTSQLQASAVDGSTIQIQLKPDNCSFELSALVPVTQPADQVMQQYQSDNCFDFEKFIEDHRPLKFTGTGILKDKQVDETINTLIESKILDAYKNIVFLKKIGFNPVLVNVLLGHESTGVNGGYASVNEPEILKPVFFAEKLERGDLSVKVSRTRILSSNEIKLDFDIYTDSDSFPKFGIVATVIFTVDHTEKKLSIQSIQDQWLEVTERDDEGDCIYNSLNGWLYDYNQIVEECEIYDNDKMEKFLTDSINSDATLKQLEGQIFE